MAILLPALFLLISVRPLCEKRAPPSAFQSAAPRANASVVGILLAGFYQPVWTSRSLFAGDFHAGGDRVSVVDVLESAAVAGGDPYHVINWSAPALNRHRICVPCRAAQCGHHRFERRGDAMPLYAYICQHCKVGFELLVRSSDTPKCPSCGSEKLKQQIARICGEIKYPKVARAWRRAAARSGDLSNFSQRELQSKKS